MSITFEGIMREKLNDFSINVDGQIHGYCDSQEEIDGLLMQLQCIGFSYSVRTSRQTDLDATRGCPKLFFRLIKANVEIRFLGYPFSVVSSCKRECILGHKYYKMKRGLTVGDHLADHVIPKPKRTLTLDTRKSGCPARFSVKCVRIYPGYSLQSENVHPRFKIEILDRLRKDLASQNKPASFLRFYVVASPSGHHTHSIDRVNASGIIHPLLANEIMSVVRKGITSVKIIKLHLESFVNKNFNTPALPDRENKTFYPTEKTIYNHVYQAVLKIKNKTIDQGAVQNQTNEWQEVSTDDKILFIPCSEVVEEVILGLQDTNSSDEINEDHDISETSSSNSALHHRAREMCRNLMELTYKCDNKTIKKLIDDLTVAQRNVESSILPLTEASTSE